VYYSVARPGDKVVAAKLSAAVAALMGCPDRGAKTRANSKGRDFYGVIRAAAATDCPHIFLIESGFHDNAEDEAFLLKEENLRRIAEVQANIIVETLGVNTSAPAKTAIIGASVLAAEQLADFLLKHNPAPKINCSALELARAFIEEGNIEGVRGDIAFCQALHETGWFRFGGKVLPEQNNFAGIGATNSSPVGKGAWFDSPQIGVRAQVQHLKAYASKEPLKQECIDPRFGLVSRGVAPAWVDLNGRWAVPGPTYGQLVLAMYEKAREFAISSVPPIIAAINTLVKHGVISSPDYWAVNYSKLEHLDTLIFNMAAKLQA
jgi:hypothetical protein